MNHSKFFYIINYYELVLNLDIWFLLLLDDFSFNSNNFEFKNNSILIFNII